MPKVIASTDVAAPADVIWALMCDPGRYPEFADPTDRMLSVPEEEFGVGSVYREHGGIPPFKDESTWRVTVFEPKRRQVHVGDDGSITFHLTVELDPSETGTHLTQTLVLKPRWYLRPPFAVLWLLFMQGRAQRAMDKTVLNVKQIAESTDAEARGTEAQ